MTKYDCVDCKRAVEILVPEENICTDCYIVRLKLQIIRLRSQSPAMQALLERWLTYFESQQEHHRMTVAEFASIKEQDEKLLYDTEALLKEAKEVKHGKH